METYWVAICALGFICYNMLLISYVTSEVRSEVSSLKREIREIKEPLLNLNSREQNEHLH